MIGFFAVQIVLLSEKNIGPDKNPFAKIFTPWYRKPLKSLKKILLKICKCAKHSRSLCQVLYFLIKNFSYIFTQ